MKKGFTKLEIILGAVIVFSIIGYLGSKNVFISKENLLRQRYYKYVSLIDTGDYSGAYNYLSSSSKAINSLDSYKKGWGNKKQIATINSIVVRDNIGYIDRTNTICNDDKCSSKKVVRGYKKWVFENGDWYFDNERDPVCIREQMYDMPPEFVRALSLIKQRFHDWFVKNNMPDPNDILFFNCVDIQYGDTGDAEGFFTFDENSSSIDKLEIKVNKSYINSDDLLTATLLVHETKHSLNYLNRLQGVYDFSCVEDEAEAFSNQLNFTGILTTEERNSLNARLLKDYRNPSSGLSILRDLWSLRDRAQKICRTNQWDNCVMKEVGPLIINYIESNPYYQKQCNLN